MYIKIDEKNRVFLRVADKFAKSLTVDNVTSFNVKTIPEVERGEVLCYNPETETFYTEKIELTKEQRERIRARATASRKREAALKWLSDNDWKVNKHTLGEWSDDDERWLAYLADRAKVRATIDAAELVLEG